MHIPFVKKKKGSSQFSMMSDMNPRENIAVGDCVLVYYNKKWYNGDVTLIKSGNNNDWITISFKICQNYVYIDRCKILKRYSNEWKPKNEWIKLNNKIHDNNSLISMNGYDYISLKFQNNLNSYLKPTKLYKYIYKNYTYNIKLNHLYIINIEYKNWDNPKITKINAITNEVKSYRLNDIILRIDMEVPKPCIFCDNSNMIHIIIMECDFFDEPCLIHYVMDQNAAKKKVIKTSCIVDIFRKHKFLNNISIYDESRNCFTFIGYHIAKYTLFIMNYYLDSNVIETIPKNEIISISFGQVFNTLRCIRYNDYIILFNNMCSWRDSIYIMDNKYDLYLSDYLFPFSDAISHEYYVSKNDEFTIKNDQIYTYTSLKFIYNNTNFVVESIPNGIIKIISKFLDNCATFNWIDIKNSIHYIMPISNIISYSKKILNLNSQYIYDYQNN